MAVAGEFVDRKEVLCVSLLKALGNDIRKNLEVPLAQIAQLAGGRGSSSEFWASSFHLA